jgi:hypothetical protein
MSCSKCLECSARNQYLATFLVNLLTISFGISVGWASPCIPVLETEASPLPSGPLSSTESSNVISILCVGGLLGNFFHGYLGER